MAQTESNCKSERMTPELLWKLGRLGSVAVSPDGKTAAYAVRRFELSENKGKSSLFLLDLTTGEESEILSNWKSIGSVYWIKNQAGERIWFEGTPTPAEPASDNSTKPTSDDATKSTREASLKDNAETKNQAWFLPVGEKKPVRSTSVADGIANFKISPTGDRIAFTVDVKLDSKVTEIYPDLPKADARIIDGLMYRHWDSWHDYAYSHLHVANLKGDGSAEEPIDLMKGIKADCPIPPTGGKEHFDWAPDGKSLAYTLKDVPDWAQSTNSDVFLVPVDGSAKPVNVSSANKGYDNNPLFSPDGKWMVYNSMQRPGFEADRNRLMLLDRESGSLKELSAGLDQNVNNCQWLPDSSGLVFDSEILGTNQIFHIEVKSGQIRPISSGQYDWQALTVLPDGKSILANRMSMVRPHELVRLNLTSPVEEKVLTRINDEVFNRLQLPTVEERMVTGTDGAKIHCWVVYPPGFDKKAGKKYPMLTYCQGGPQSQIGQFFSYRWNFHLMAANDYVVVAVNRRGLPGFGQKWNDDISGDWGGQAMKDLLAATDDMKKESYIDSKRVAAVGASFGGYSVYWLMGNAGDRFCAMISHCGVFNLESMYGTTEELFFVNHDLGGAYWRSPEIMAKYQKFSPHRFIGNWKTPLLVIHGEKDFRVPIGQGMEAFTAAQTNGVPSRFLYFPEEGHWVTSPQNSVLWNRVFFDWLDRYCKPKSDK